MSSKKSIKINELQSELIGSLKLILLFLFFSAQNSDPQIIVKPPVATVLPGESVSFMCSVAHKFTQCRFVKFILIYK